MQKRIGVYRGMGIDRLTTLWAAIHLSPIALRQLADTFHDIFAQHVSNITTVTADEVLLSYLLFSLFFPFLL